MFYKNKKKPDLANVRKMAAKKGGQIPFQTDISCQEEWDNCIQNIGLTVIDVYTEWCGPCVAMVSTLKKIKLDIGSDFLHFAIAKSNCIECLKRFRNRSEPTWLFMAGGHLVRVLFGANSPEITLCIKEELDVELEVLKGGAERKWIPFNELSAMEKEHLEETEKRNEINTRKERQKLESRYDVMRKRSLKKLANIMKDTSCIIYFPQTLDADGNCDIAKKIALLHDSISVEAIDQKLIQLDCQMISQQDFRQNLSENSLKASHENPVLVTLLQSIVSPLEENAISSSSSSLPSCTFDTIEQKLCFIVYGDTIPVYFTNNPASLEFLEEDENGCKLYPVWTPKNSLSKAAALQILFPEKMQKAGYKGVEFPPPQIILIYEASKANDIQLLIDEFQEHVYKFGFFDSVIPETANMISDNVKKFKNLSDENAKSLKIVLSLKMDENDEVLLEFSQLMPIYISPDEVTGTEESEIFFRSVNNDE